MDLVMTFEVTSNNIERGRGVRNVSIISFLFAFKREFLHGNALFKESVSTILLERQERHNKGTLTASITTNRSHYKMDAIGTHEERKPARAYNSNTMPQELPAGATCSSA